MRVLERKKTGFVVDEVDGLYGVAGGGIDDVLVEETVACRVRRFQHIADTGMTVENHFYYRPLIIVYQRRRNQS